MVSHSYVIGIFPHRHLFMTTFSFAERRTISIGALRSTFNALLFRRGSRTSFLSCCFLSRLAPVTRNPLFPLSAFVFAVVFSDANKTPLKTLLRISQRDLTFSSY